MGCCATGLLSLTMNTVAIYRRCVVPEAQLSRIQEYTDYDLDLNLVTDSMGI